MTKNQTTENVSARKLQTMADNAREPRTPRRTRALGRRGRGSPPTNVVNATESGGSPSEHSSWNTDAHGSSHFGGSSRGLRKLVSSLAIPEPFSVETFVDLLAAKRGRPIILSPVPRMASAGLGCGVWAVTAEVDRIFYEAETTPLHMAQIIGHEVGHILAGHEPRQGMEHLTEAMMPNLDISLVTSALMRFGYSHHEEGEAELVGTMILRRALATYNWQPLPEGADPSLVNQIRVLGGRRP